MKRLTGTRRCSVEISQPTTSLPSTTRTGIRAPCTAARSPSPGAASPGSVSPGTVSPGTVSPGTASSARASPPESAKPKQASRAAPNSRAWVGFDAGTNSSSPRWADRRSGWMRGQPGPGLPKVPNPPAATTHSGAIVDLAPRARWAPYFRCLPLTSSKAQRSTWMAMSMSLCGTLTATAPNPSPQQPVKIALAISFRSRASVMVNSGDLPCGEKLM
jgi:hypothetical protein